MLLDPVARYKISLEIEAIHEKRLIMNHVIHFAKAQGFPPRVLEALTRRWTNLNELYDALCYVLGHQDQVESRP